MLSIGCPVKQRSYSNHITKGLAAWGLAQTDMFMQSASMNALNMAKLLNKHTVNEPTIYRIQPTLQGTDKPKLDNVSSSYLEKLVAVGKKDAMIHVEEIGKVFFQKVRTDFTFDNIL